MNKLGNSDHSVIDPLSSLRMQSLSPLARVAPREAASSSQPQAPVDQADLTGVAEQRRSRQAPSLGLQLKVGLSLALSCTGALAGVLTSSAPAGADPLPPQALVQVKPAEATPASPGLGDQQWLLAGQKSVPVQDTVKQAPPPNFVPAEPVAQKGDYVKHGVNFSQLLSDAEFSRVDGVTVKMIQDFLEARESFLADYKVGEEPVSEVIMRVAQEQKVNPWIVLTTLEKENSMVSRQKVPGQGVLKSAMGYGYTDSGNRAGKRSNFESQLTKGVGLLRELFEEGQQQSFPLNLKVDYGKRTIPVRNAATYALMRYTPHTVDTGLRQVGGGNYLFRRVLENFTQEAMALVRA